MHKKSDQHDYLKNNMSTFLKNRHLPEEMIWMEKNTVKEHFCQASMQHIVNLADLSHSSAHSIQQAVVS